MRNPSQNFPMRGSRPSLNKAWECHGRMAAVCITLLLLGPRQQDSGFEGCCFPGLPLLCPKRHCEPVFIKGKIRGESALRQETLAVEPASKSIMPF